jgi:hypothetical protein
MIRKHKFLKRVKGSLCICGKAKGHKIHIAAKPTTRRRQARHPAASTPEPMHHADEGSLEKELHSLLANAGTYLATADYPGLVSVSHVATLEESGYETNPQDRGLMLTMNDGAVFRLTLLQEKRSELDFPDQSE